ncbi:hypothetical protein EJP02_309 [Escherichia phage EJP2]|nr:hypothetical protein EJP02_309 [Escherichia phage EJP2]
MNFIVTYAQILGLNIMLIIIACTSPTAAFSTYLVLCIVSLVIAIVYRTLFTRALGGELDIPHEWKFIPHTFPKENKVTYICSTIIHMGLSIFILHSFVLPIMMLVILVVRIYNCNLFEKILLCQK